MVHFFQTEIAVEYGVNAAIVLENLNFWISKNKANGMHFHDGHYWTYNSFRAFEELFPYMGTKALRNAIKTLEENGLVITGDYNKTPYDRTKWYALTEKAESMFQKGTVELTERANRNEQKGEPIPDNNPNNNPDTKERIIRKKFVPPTLDEITAYVKARNSSVDPKKFYDYYSEADWKDSEGKSVKSWKQKLITWEGRNGRVSGTPTESTEERKARWNIRYDNDHIG